MRAIYLFRGRNQQKLDISQLLSFTHVDDHQVNKKNNFTASFYACGSTASSLEPLRGGSLLFTSKSPEISGTDFMNLGKMKSRVNLGATQWF